jgi:anti-anti-sigma factor
VSHEVQIEWHEKVPVFRISGKMLENTEDSPLWDAIDSLPEANHKVVIDLTEVKIMNSSGIGLCLKCFTSLRNKGGEVVFCGVSNTVGHLFLLTKLNSIFTISADVASALQLLKSQDA